MTDSFLFDKKESIDCTFLQNTDHYSVNEKDSLFWGLYILIYGYHAYESLLPTSFLREKEEKFKFMEILKDPYNKTMLKEKQVKLVKNETEDNLANDDLISVKTFIILAILHKIDFLFVENKKVFYKGMTSAEVGDNPKLFIVRYDPCKKECRLDLYFHKDTVKKLLDTFFPWENIEKPLKAISYYTSEELLNIATKMGFDSPNEKPTKRILYDYIKTNVT